MEQGKEIGRLARSLYPEGIFVNELSSPAAAARTRDLLANPDTHSIFEATFLAGSYIAKADILVRDAKSWELIEVKSSVVAKDELIDDMAYTTMVAQVAGFSPSTISLMLIDKNYRFGMPVERLFVKTDMTEQVLARVEEFKTAFDYVDSVSSTPEEPEPRLIFNCKQCEYFSECVGEGVQSHIFNIPRLRQTAIEELIASGIISIRDIPDSFSLSDNQRRVVECVRRGTMQVDPVLRQKLAGIHWPVFYLDFETMMTALPLWPNIAPYEQIPVQYSLHICESSGNIIRHMDYLADPHRDCRRELAKRLIVDLKGEGSIITYSSFEKTTISALSRIFPDLADNLQSLIGRIVDLEPCIKCINHPEFCGRTSIKIVLPVLVPDLSYEGLEIANGDAALVTFAMMAQGKMGADEMERKRAALLEYCTMDTLAMVRLHEVLHGFVPHQ
jgi:CRISPR/Cas system-associated exonuclease Cas4 (RecB family)